MKSDDDLIDDLVKGDIKWYQVENLIGGDTLHATKLRRQAMERITGEDLGDIGSFSLDTKFAMMANIENMIGVAQIPMGITDPIVINGEYAKGKFFIPMATTEGALIASVSRGCSTITRAGGAVSRVIRDGITRGPALKAGSAADALEVVRFAERNFNQIKAVADATDPFIELTSLKPLLVGRTIFLRFEYGTGDAMGMNMVTIATDAALKFIEEKFPDISHVALSGNLCIDKKPAAINLIEGRGKSVVSEVVLSSENVSTMLKTTPEAIADVVYRKCHLGSELAGSYGFNAHFANMVAAIFLATGQDEAHVVEGSIGFTTAEILENGDLHFAVTLPSLPIGTIGGGTGLGTQQQALSILGVVGPGDTPGANARKFAEVIGGAVLAGELSLCGALASRHLAESHIRLNR